MLVGGLLWWISLPYFFIPSLTIPIVFLLSILIPVLFIAGAILSYLMLEKKSKKN